MQQTICAVCKTPIDEALVVETEHGPVHPGVCLNHAQDIPVTENTTSVLQETELLM